MSLNLWKTLPLTVNSVQAVAQLEQELFTQPWSYAAIEEELSNKTAVCKVLQHIETGEIGAYLLMHHVLDELYIERIATAPQWRRQGFSTKLLKTACDFAKENGVLRITLEVRVSNRPAIALYEQNGFVCDGIRPRFYDDPKEDAFIYSLYMTNGEERA